MNQDTNKSTDINIKKGREKKNTKPLVETVVEGSGIIDAMAIFLARRLSASVQFWTALAETTTAPLSDDWAAAAAERGTTADSEGQHDAVLAKGVAFCEAEAIARD